jgi:hypothetical protein
MIRKFGLGAALAALMNAAPFALMTGSLAADDKSDFDALLQEHWARANQEQIFFRTDPDA